MPAFRFTSFDPLQSFRFNVEYKGILAGQFTECEGLSLEREVISHKEGGVNDYVHQLPGRVTQQKVMLRRGYISDQGLWDWFQRGIMNGKVERVNMTIYVLNNKRTTIQTWDLISAFPVKYEGPTLKADSIEAALEKLEIAHHGLRLTIES